MSEIIWYFLKVRPLFYLPNPLMVLLFHCAPVIIRVQIFPDFLFLICWESNTWILQILPSTKLFSLWNIIVTSFLLILAKSDLSLSLSLNSTYSRCLNLSNECISHPYNPCQYKESISFFSPRKYPLILIIVALEASVGTCKLVESTRNQSWINSIFHKEEESGFRKSLTGQDEVNSKQDSGKGWLWSYRSDFSTLNKTGCEHFLVELNSRQSFFPASNQREFFFNFDKNYVVYCLKFYCKLLGNSFRLYISTMKTFTVCTIAFSFLPLVSLPILT